MPDMHGPDHLQGPCHIVINWIYVSLCLHMELQIDLPDLDEGQAESPSRHSPCTRRGIQVHTGPGTWCSTA